MKNKPVVGQRVDNLEGVENTSAIGTLLGQGLVLVTKLDAIMHNKYARQPDVLRAWMSASYVGSVPRHGRRAPPCPCRPPRQPAGRNRGLTPASHLPPRSHCGRGVFLGWAVDVVTLGNGEDGDRVTSR